MGFDSAARSLQSDALPLRHAEGKTFSPGRVSPITCPQTNSPSRSLAPMVKAHTELPISYQPHIRLSLGCSYICFVSSSQVILYGAPAMSANKLLMKTTFNICKTKSNETKAWFRSPFMPSRQEMHPAYSTAHAAQNPLKKHDLQNSLLLSVCKPNRPVRNAPPLTTFYPRTEDCTDDQAIVSVLHGITVACPRLLTVGDFFV